MKEGLSLNLSYCVLSYQNGKNVKVKTHSGNLKNEEYCDVSDFFCGLSVQIPEC